MRPTHPEGFHLADDSPAFIAPALELRRAVEATMEGEVESAVAFTLAFPISERFRDYPRDEPLETTSPDAERDFDGNDTLQDLPAMEPAAPSRRPIPMDSESTIERNPYKDSGEVTLVASEHQTLVESLRSIGPFESAPDLSTDRPAQARVLLARARAIRFRLALLELWPEDYTRANVIEDALDLVLHPAVIVALADGAPADASGRSPADLSITAALIDEVRSGHPEIVRAMLRDAGAATYARITLLGTERAIEYVRARFAEYPAKARRDALALAGRVAGSAREGSPPAIALARLGEALQGA